MKYRIEKRSGVNVLLDGAGVAPATAAEVYFYKRLKRLISAQTKQGRFKELSEALQLRTLEEELSAAEAELAAAREDTARIDWLAARWNSQGKGHYICGKWVPNVTGSFRDALDAEKNS